MKITFGKTLYAATLASALLTTGVAYADFDDLLGKVGVAKDLVGAATVSDKDVIKASAQMVAHHDSEAKIAPAGNKYAQRLSALTSKHTSEDGLKLNYKVYLSPDVNAFCTADGSIRIYSGLMDLMNDDELRSVIGHEIGHAKLGHMASRMKTAYMASAGRKAAAQADGAVGKIADSQLGDMFEKVVNAQFSQSNESASDDYGFAFMKKHKYDVKAMESAFRKLAKTEGGSHSMMSSHPGSAARADRMKQKAGG
ncbi:MAG: M48 family metallopeptidase [Pseudomonadota bacterium]